MHDTYLAHHGIKGMKWGVRRFRNEDGTLTEAGRKRYNVDIEKAERKRDKAFKSMNKAYEKGTWSQYEKKEQLYKLAKENVSNERIKQKLNDDSSAKSKRRLALEQQYRNKGMNDEEAAVSAYRRERTERILAVAGATTVAAATAYVAYRRWDNSVDKTIRSGDILARIASNDGNHVNRGEYVAYKKRDIYEKYLGLYGKQKMDRGQAVYQKFMRASDSIKIASRESGRKELSKMVAEDSQFKNELRDYLAQNASRRNVFNSSPAQIRAFNNAVRDLDRGVVTGDVYDAFNNRLVDHNNQLVQSFSKRMRKLGYGAIEDMNDKRLSGFDATRPLILIAPKAVRIEGIRNVGRSEIQRQFNAYVTHDARKSLLKDVVLPSALAVGAGVGVASGTMQWNRTASRDKIVSDYRNEHPNTKLSYNEILERYYRSD